MRKSMWGLMMVALVLVLVTACSPPEAEEEGSSTQVGSVSREAPATVAKPSEEQSESEVGTTGGCPELPVYPGAKVYTEADLDAADLMEQLEEMGGYGVIRVYLTKQASDEVHGWYQEALSADGWERTMQFSMGDQGLSIWERDDLSVQVVTGPEEGQTAIIVGCGDTDAIAQAASVPAATATPAPTPTMDASAGAIYGEGDSFSFGGATLDVIGHQELSRVAKFMSDGEYYQPDQGKYVVVAFGFQGETDKGSLDYGLFRLMDGQGRVYAMDSETYSQECSALANTHGYDYLMRWTDQERAEALLVFDVSADASGLRLGLVSQEEARVLDVVVELGGETEIVPVDTDEESTGESESESAQGGASAGGICGSVPSYAHATAASVDEITSSQLLQQVEDMGNVDELYAYWTADATSMVKDHYMQAMEDAGWSMMFEMAAEGGVLVIWTHGDNMAQLAIGSDGGKTAFILGCGPNG